jgi:hypothetical protein
VRRASPQPLYSNICTAAGSSIDSVISKKITGTIVPRVYTDVNIRNTVYLCQNKLWLIQFLEIRWGIDSIRFRRSRVHNQKETQTRGSTAVFGKYSNNIHTSSIYRFATGPTHMRMQRDTAEVESLWFFGEDQ